MGRDWRAASTRQLFNEQAHVGSGRNDRAERRRSEDRSSLPRTGELDQLSSRRGEEHQRADRLVDRVQCAQRQHAHREQFHRVPESAVRTSGV